VYPKRLERPTDTLRPRRVRELSGPDVPVAECARILTALGFEPQGEGGEERLAFVVPTWRTDVSI
jgi:phenylalanyl-tRNA synthetase beta subunit